MEIYHLLNRGVEKRNIVLNNGDRARFVHCLYVFNDIYAAPNYILHDRAPESITKHDREPLVHIHAWCLMNNHYHLLVSEIHESGISRFMQKLNMGYTKYFNEKYERSGTLWQSKYKKIEIVRDAHFLYIPYYIHLNPLDYAQPEWREGKVKNISKALEFLSGYRWSSFSDYIGKKNFPSLIHHNLLGEILGTAKQQGNTIRDIISDQDTAAASRTLEM